MNSVSLSEKYDDLVESVSVWYGFFRESGVEPGQAASRVISQMHNVVAEDRYLLLIAYLVLLEEVLTDQDLDEEVAQYLFGNLKEDCKNELMVFQVLVEQISPAQRADLVQHLEAVQGALVSLASPSMIRISEELGLVG